MPKYEVVKSPGIQFPVGMTFETDALHASMFQHVRRVDGKKTPAGVKTVGDSFVVDADEAYDLAYAELESRDAKAAPKVAPKAARAPKAAETPPPVIDGPGENS